MFPNRTGTFRNKDLSLVMTVNILFMVVNILFCSCLDQSVLVDMGMNVHDDDKG